MIPSSRHCLLVVDDEPDVCDSVHDLLRRESEPGGTILVSHIREAISIAAGEMDHELQLPSGNVVFGTGKIAVPGIITWAV